MNLELVLLQMAADVIRQYRAQQDTIAAIAIHIHRTDDPPPALPGPVIE
jgi:hypothetical protein